MSQYDLGELVAMARKWLWLFVLATLVAAVGAWLATRAMPRQYASQTTLMVGRATQDPTPDYQAIYLSETLAGVYARMATRAPVLQGVVNELDLQVPWQVLRGMVQAKEVPGSQFIEIRVITTDPVRAQVLADAVAKQLIAQSPTPQNVSAGEQEFVAGQLEQLRASIETADQEIADIESRITLETSARAIAELENRRTALEQKKAAWQQQYAQLRVGTEGSEVNSLVVIERATPGELVGPRARQNVLLAATLGFGLALLAVLGLEYLDDTVKTTADAAKRLGLTGLGTIEHMADSGRYRDALVTLRHPRSPVAEAYRVLRTNLEFSLLSSSTQSLLVTSPNPGEGKSVTAANLAVVMAQASGRVILVDADLRRPVQHRIFQLPNSVGMTSLLLDAGLALEEVLGTVESVPDLRVLTSGPLPPNPAEVLRSKRMTDLLRALTESTDFLILDSPPVLLVADAAILAGMTGGTVVVCQSGVTRTGAARSAVEALEAVGVKPLGVVINDLDRSRVGSYYYTKYYYYSKYGYYYYYGDGRERERETVAAGESDAEPVVEKRTVHRHRRHRTPLRRVIDDLRSALG